MSELKPCPFCGGEAALVPTLKTTVREWFVTCNNLECSVLACRTKRYYTEAEAIAAWNTRYHSAFEETVIKAWEEIKAYQERTCQMNWVKKFPEYEDCIFECWECSACKRTNDEQRPRFCPNCGAKVVGE